MTRYWRSRPLSGVDAVALLGLASGDEERCFLRSREGWEIAGLGQAVLLTASGRERLESLSTQAVSCYEELESLDEPSLEGAAAGLRPLFVGGFSFDRSWSADESSAWRGFAPARLVLPELSLLRRGERSFLLAVAPAGTSPQTAAELLDRRLSEAAATLEDGERYEVPAPTASIPGGDSAADTVGSPLHYEGQVRAALDAIAAGTLDKVTVARCETLGAQRPLELVELISELRERFPECFVFCIQPPGAAAFIGASPEQLLSCRGGAIQADALAGTARRGRTPAEDRSLGAALLEDPKERREHAAVVDYLHEALASVTGTLDAAEQPALLRLANVQHLHTPFRGRLLNGEGVLDLLDRVHPTPAVAGLPRSEAVQWLAREEALDRGWYAGGVGVVGADGDGEFCVAIRSGLVSQRSIRIFAGAGIVEGSRPERERAEVDEKLAGLKEVLLHA